MKILIILGAVGCAAPAGPHVVSGTVEQHTFTAPVDHVVIVQSGIVVVSAPLSNDAFSVTIPAGTGYRLELASSYGLISPRATGIVSSTFAVRGGGTPFQTGTVRAIAPGAHFIYGPTPGECQDGTDGAGDVCVDDQQAENCGEGDNSDSSDSQDGETADDQSMQAVADHNIPSSIGCEDGGDSGGDHQNDGEEQGDH